MGWLSSIIGSGLGSAISSILAPVLGYFTSKDTLVEKGFEVGAATDKEVQIAYLQTQVQMAQLQATQNQWWGARLIVLLCAGSCSIHFSAVMLDSVPWFGHVVGSWKVPALPAPYDGYESKILLSFFILTPIAPTLSAVASWLHK